MTFISLKEEFAFREVFALEPVRKQFVSDVTGIPQDTIKEIRIVSPFLRKRFKKQKLGILDLALTLNDDTKLDIEVQLRPQRFWIKRNLFYLAHLYADELWIGENYDKLKKSITISILDFRLIAGQQYHSVYTLKDRNGKELTDLFEVHIIELKKTLTGDNPIDSWIRLFNAETEEDLQMVKNINIGVSQAVEALKRLSLGRSARWHFEQSLKAKRDRWAEDEYVREQGREQGALMRDQQLIKVWLQKGYSVEYIAELLDEEVDSVRQMCERLTGK